MRHELIALLLTAEPSERFELAWTAPEGCPDRAQIAAAVALQLGRAPGRAEDPELVAAIVVDERDGGWHAQLELVVDGNGGVRELQAEGCDTLADAVVFVVAATIDPAVTPRETDFDALPRADELWLARQDVRLRSPSPRRAAASLLPRRASPRPRAPTPSLRVGIAAAAVLAIGPLPGVAGGIAGALALLHRRVRVELGGTFLAAKRARFDGRPAAGGELRLVAADARACPRWSWGGFGLDACAGVQVGVVHGRGFGIDQPATTRQPWVALTAGPRISYAPLRRLAFVLGADLLVPIVRPAFGVDGLGRLWRPLPAGFSGALGVELRLP